MADAFPVALHATGVPPRSRKTNYPAPFAARVEGREKRPLGDAFGLANFGVNLTRLLPGSESALRHAHSMQDEFVYILSGQPTLITDAGEVRLESGMCAGFRAGTGNAHHLVNRGTDDVVYLEIGDRSSGDVGTFPDDDLSAVLETNGLRFTHKDGSLY